MRSRLKQLALSCALFATNDLKLIFAQEEESSGDSEGPPPPPPAEEEPPPPEEPPVVEEPEPPPPAAEPEPVMQEEVQIMDKLAHATQEQEKTRLRRLLREKVEENQKMKNAGHHWMVGSWLYGDLAHGIIHEDHLTAHGCADHCEANNECYHWVYYLDSGRCDLKVNGGGHNADVDHMIVGHAKRFLNLKAKGSGTAEL